MFEQLFASPTFQPVFPNRKQLSRQLVFLALRMATSSLCVAASPATIVAHSIASAPIAPQAISAPALN
jgi:hypothetical protein